MRGWSSNKDTINKSETPGTRDVYKIMSLRIPNHFSSFIALISHHYDMLFSRTSKKVGDKFFLKLFLHGFISLFSFFKEQL